MIKFLLFSISLILTHTICSQVIIVEKIIYSDSQDSPSISIDFFEHGMTKSSFLQFPTTGLVITGKVVSIGRTWSNNRIELPSLNDSSVLKISTDTKGGYLTIEGLTKLRQDTLRLKNIHLIQNELAYSYVTKTYYFPAPVTRKDKKPRYKEKFYKAKDLDSSKIFPLHINDTILLIELKPQMVCHQEYSSGGFIRHFSYNYRSTLLRREPKRHIKYRTHYISCQGLWIGNLEL